MPILHLAHGRQLVWGEGRTLVMGVVNATPDSFSDGGLHAEADAAVARALELAADGADIIDIGGESSRPGAADVPLEEETRRVLPVVEGLVAERPDLLISVDTIEPRLARRAIEAGAHLVNDITGGRDNPGMLDIVIDTGAAYCIMHMRGNPRTMQSEAHYDDVAGEVGDFFAGQLAELKSRGLPDAPDHPCGERVLLDPGIGFGKLLEHNLALLRASAEFQNRFGCPVLVGASRKSMLGRLTGIDNPIARDRPTITAHVAAVARGAAMVRVHDVAAAVESFRVADPLLRDHETD